MPNTPRLPYVLRFFFAVGICCATYDCGQEVCAVSGLSVENHEDHEGKATQVKMLQLQTKNIKNSTNLLTFPDTVNLTTLNAEASRDDSDYAELSQVFQRANLKAKLQLLKDFTHIIPSMVAASRLNLWDAIPTNNGETFDEIISRTKTSAKGMDSLLQVMLSIGAVTWNSDTERIYNEFSKYPDTKEFTTSILGESVAMQRQLYYLADSVREGRAVGLTEVYGDYESIYEARADIPELSRDWDPWMNSHDGYMAAKISMIIFQLPSVVARIGKNSKNFEGHVLDWCGNDGTNAIQLAQRDPTMKLTVMDLPAQVAKAATRIQTAGLQAQIDTMGVDLLDGDPVFEQKYEAVFMINMQREWSWSELTRFAKIIHGILKPGGVVVSFPITDRTGLKSFGNYTFVQKYPKYEVYFLNSASHTQCPKTGNEFVSMLANVGFTDVTYSSKLDFVVATKQ